MSGDWLVMDDNTLLNLGTVLMVSVEGNEGKILLPGPGSPTLTVQHSVFERLVEWMKGKGCQPSRLVTPEVKIVEG
jgi:hypothetical protein